MKKYILILLLFITGATFGNSNINPNYPPAFQPYLIPFQNTDMYQIYNALSLRGCCCGDSNFNGYFDTTFTNNLVLDSTPVRHLSQHNILYQGTNGIVYTDTTQYWRVGGNRGVPNFALMGTTDGTPFAVGDSLTNQFMFFTTNIVGINAGVGTQFRLRTVDTSTNIPFGKLVYNDAGQASAGAFLISTDINGEAHWRTFNFYSASDTVSTLATQAFVENSLTGLNYWGLTGNAGTTAGTNFIGTTDGADLVFKVGSTPSGGLSQGTGNTSFGLASYFTGGGLHNTAIGQSALSSNTDDDNTAVGFLSLNSNLTGFSNTAVGRESLNSNTTGSNNTALGYQADVTAPNLQNSTAIGAGASVGLSNSVVLGNGANTYVGKNGLGVNGLILQDSAGVCWLYTATVGTGALVITVTVCP